MRSLRSLALAALSSLLLASVALAGDFHLRTGTANSTTDGEVGASTTCTAINSTANVLLTSGIPQWAGGLIFQVETATASAADVNLRLCESGSLTRCTDIDKFLCNGPRADALECFFTVPLVLPSGMDLVANTGLLSTANACVTWMPRNNLSSTPFYRRKLWREGAGPNNLVQVDPGGTAHAKGSWFELTSSSVYPTEDQHWLQVLANLDGNATTTTASFLCDFAITASGSATGQVIIIADQRFQAEATSDLVLPAVVDYPALTVPANHRIWARCQSSITDATDRLIFLGLAGHW